MWRDTVEGIANFFAATRAWNNKAVLDTTTTTPTNCTVNQQGIGQNCPHFFSLGELETLSSADCFGSNFLVEACITSAFWDAWDDPSTDDDPITAADQGVNVATIVNILNGYDDGCWPIADRCSNEGGEDGLNHFDFLFNWDITVNDNQLSTDLRSIYSTLDLDAGGDGPWN